MSFWTFIDRAVSVILLVMLALSLAMGATLFERRSPDFLPCAAEESASADIEVGTAAVRCPACRRHHHERAGLPC